MEINGKKVVVIGGASGMGRASAELLHAHGASVAIFDREGQPIPDRGATVFLCRCGRSADKPFCDGSHARTGWKEDT